MKKVLLAINIDRVRSPIATLMREVSSRLKNVEIHTFSSPQNAEDLKASKQFFNLEHTVKIGYTDLLKHQYDYVWHASITPSNLAIVMLARLRSLMAIKHVMTANVEPDDNLKYKYLFKFAYRLAHKIVAVSNAVKGTVEGLYGVNVSKVIPNGFDENTYRLKTSTVKKYTTQAPYFLFCGALTYRKRPDVIIEIAKRLPEQKFIMVGSNPSPKQGDEYKTQIEKIPNIEYLGRKTREEVRDLMQDATALIFPSEREGLPLSVIEAMACGCPVLAQPKSSLPELVKDNVNGFLLNVDDISHWVDKCLLLRFASPFEASSVHDTVVNKYNWNVIAHSYEEIFV